MVTEKVNYVHQKSNDVLNCSGFFKLFYFSDLFVNIFLVAKKSCEINYTR